MADIVMPRLSESMEEGTVVEWLKNPGDEVHRGDGLVQIETDKATMTYEADGDGILEIVAEVGRTLAVGEVIARIVTQPSARAPRLGRLERTALAPQLGTTAKTERSSKVEPSARPGDQLRGAFSSHEPSIAFTRRSGSSSPRGLIKASPLARKLAHERAVDLTSLRGSGPGGRIVRADVEALLIERSEDARPDRGSSAAKAPVDTRDEQEVKGVPTRQTPTRSQNSVARRMAESHAAVPVFALQAEINMERCAELRDQMAELSVEPAVTYNDLIVRACALALKAFPRANGAYREGSFELYSRVNIGIAVSAGEELLVPTIFDADAKPLRQIAEETRRLSERVHAGVITPHELSGGTFTVSNLGMFGVTNFTPVINPPQAAILAAGGVRPRPVAIAGQPTVRHMMDVTLACDHRILYGSDAARFLARIRSLLECPLSLLLDL